MVFFVVSVLINSQGAVVVAMLPLAYELGIAGPVLLGVLPSVYGYFFIPNYPSDIATVNFDMRPPVLALQPAGTGALRLGL